MDKLKHIWGEVSFHRRIVWFGCFLGLLILTGGNYFWADLNLKRVSASQEKEKAEKTQQKASQEKQFAVSVTQMNENRLMQAA